MKKLVILFLLIYAFSYAQEQNIDSGGCYDECYGINSVECYYQRLLKRWYEGADGQGQGPVDSTVLNLFRERDYVNRFPHIQRSPGILKAIEDNLRYRGLGIKGGGNRVDIAAQNLLKKYYNIDVELKDIDVWSWGVARYGGGSRYLVIGILKAPGLPEDEHIIMLESQFTGEILSTYKGKRKAHRKFECW